MKKIIALVLALACALGLMACAPANEDLTPYTEALANTTPASAIINVTIYDTEFDIELDGVYTVTYNEDGTAAIEYEYEVMNLANEGDGIKDTVTGSATIAADGTVTGDVDASVVAATTLNISLTAGVKSYAIAKGILTANIEKANTAQVLGAELPSDASLELRMADNEGTKISQATIDYSNDRGTVRIVCRYD